jgi:lipopolysaccharide export system protein LptA
MRITIAHLRSWIVGLAIVLVTTLVLFFAYARYKVHRLIGDLPDRLGAHIVRSSDGYTFSQTGKNGKTAFTIHASKAIQFSNGNGATLHDVVITLYGAQGDRSDRISGAEFDYDQKNQIVSGKGEVQIDLQGMPSMPAKNDGSAAKAATPSEPSQGMIHVKTSGLVFNQKTQVATTPEYVEFQTSTAAGHATGATYKVQDGLLVLGAAVELSSSRDNKPVMVHASHAEFVRNSMQAFLLNPVSDYESQHTSSDQAIVYFRKDGSAEHIDAQGHVHLTTDDGREVTARTAKILLDEHGQPLRADAGGGLFFVSNPKAASRDPHQMHGSAVEGTLQFDDDGLLHHAQIRNAVSLVDQQHGLADDPQGSSTRELQATQVDISFVKNPAGVRANGLTGQSIADQVLAKGAATIILHTIHSKAPSQDTTIKGDQLLATLKNGNAITSLHGTGHTSVTDTASSGASNVSSGDTLQANFVAAANGHPAENQKSTSAPGASSLQSFAQDGNVVMVQTPAYDAKNTVAPVRATARHADFTSASQLLRLEGSPRINDGSTDITADAINYHRDTALAQADGNVKATTVSATKPGTSPAQAAPSGAPAGIGGQGPTHIVAASATLDQSHGRAIFRGQARLWQGANSVTAPVIELLRNPETLKAYSEAGAPGNVVTVMTTASGPRHQPTIMRVHSRQLLYSDTDQKATFTGAVSAEDSDGGMHADQIEAFLTAAKNAPTGRPATAATQGENTQSRIDRVVATGHVVLQQPERRGTGEKLLYTAENGRFVLTGTSATPPHLYDQVHGTVSGEALIFNSQDDSVSVSGGQSRAVTDTRTAK